jgi:putative CocE/NonD family hydrolase
MGKRMSLFVPSIVAWTLIILPTSLAIENASKIEVRLDVKIPMRDSVELSANIFLPEVAGKFPTILVRTPYGKGDEKHKDGLYFANHGYVFVIQDCRGTGNSRGRWEPYLNERVDGLDTHQWILKQPWSNGSIGTTGGSFVGFTQWAPSPNAGEYLKAMFTEMPLVDPYWDGTYVNGAFLIDGNMDWATWMSLQPGEKDTTRNWNRDDWIRAYRTLPLCEWDRAIGRKIQFLRDWVAHPHYDDYWAARGVYNRWKDISVPIIAVSGWYDFFAKSILDHVNAVKAMSSSPHARNHQHVLMGPWVHGVSKTGKVGELDFGKESLVDFRNIRIKWFDHWLKGKDTGTEEWPPFRIFVMGQNKWRDEQEWPLKRTRYVPYYLHSSGSANTVKGDGRLGIGKPSSEPFDIYVYDPNNPVIAPGYDVAAWTPGPRDQTQSEQRRDVLVFTSDELKAELEVTGPIKVILYAASSAEDTDWTGKLIDVHPDDRAFNLCDGIMRARYRESLGKPMLIQPMKIYRYEIDLGVTSNVFQPGHKIRVEISSSNFPRFDRNLNTGEPFGTGTTWKKAEQAVYHDGDHPSHILLPVIP